MGINPSTASRWEDGSSAPDLDALLQLSKKLDLRPEFFLRPIFEHERPSFLRSLSGALVRDRDYQLAHMRWLQEISSIVEHYVDLPEVDIPDVIGTSSYRQLRDEDLEEIALELRHHWHLGEGPCTDMVTHLERVGVVVGAVEIGTSKLDGICSWSPLNGRPHVLLADDKMSFARRQMDAAHEMAHAVLHRQVTAEELRNDLKFIEAQAFRLASAFLMPSTSYPIALREPSLAAFMTQKESWRVSIKAQIKRLFDLDIISTELSTHLYKLYSAKGWSRGEPFDDVWSLQQPRLLRDALNLIVDQNVRSKADLLAVEFTLPAGDIEGLTNLSPGWFSRDKAEVVSLRRNPGSYSAPQDGTSLVLPFPGRRS